jgi:hypothetical protein
MRDDLEQSAGTRSRRASGIAFSIARINGAIVGLAALVWFLLRVVPKPSRATYPCQRAVFPVASAFVIWVCASMAGIGSVVGVRRLVHRYRWAALCLCALMLVGSGAWLHHSRAVEAASIVTRYDFQPKQRNVPLGVARGVYPGRVVWVRAQKRDRLNAARSGSLVRCQQENG